MNLEEYRAWVIVTCPHCGRSFVVEDKHKPVKCPHCGALLVFRAPDFEPEVLYAPNELASGERA